MKITTTAPTRAAAIFCTALALAFGAQAAAPKIMKKVPPEFPAEAAKASVSSGVVKAKMLIDADGAVTGVDIVEAQPRKVFDKAVIRALMDWRFEASGEKQSHEVKLVFNNED
ncbi:energy transducer TonB [Roseateles sp.]|uniref:energy transducer TonB n=1 Tax=Roseateles sp. TaxID=1971397 RepID=UPI00286D48A1|nr:energy transducer TonB [Roseateles sp.]